MGPSLLLARQVWYTELQPPMAAPIPSGRVRFRVFELDLCSGELRKQGIKIKLHDQPFQVLAMLLEHAGEVVTREQLRQKLWPADTFVDFDVGSELRDQEAAGRPGRLGRSAALRRDPASPRIPFHRCG